jgi:hypothetical protein
VTAAPERISRNRGLKGATDEELSRAVAWSRQWSAEFPHFLANHLPMVLVALQRMGASAERLEAYCHIYHDTNHLVPTPAPVGQMNVENWREFLGQREREGDYRRFFSDEIVRLGATPAAHRYLPQLLPGFAASALHAFMRMAYATMTDNDEETAVALAYWASMYLSLGAATGSGASTEDPLQVIGLMYGPSCFRQIETERDLLWHFMRAVAEKPEFAPVVDSLAIGPGTRRRAAQVSLALLAATGDFCALHAVTGMHWLRMIEPRTPDATLALRYLWQAVVALVPKMGFPVVPTDDELAHRRRASLPEWREIFSEAVTHDDEHDLSLTFSAAEEFKVYGDPLYKYVAAKRLKMV